MCRGCEYFAAIGPSMPDELRASEVLCLAHSILDAYLSSLSDETKIEISKELVSKFLDRPMTLVSIN